MKRISLHNLLQGAFAALLLMGALWLLWPWHGQDVPAAGFLPTPSPTVTRVRLQTVPTATAFVPTATPEPVIHIVQAGEVLGIIAKEYGTTAEAIMAANNIKDADFVREGQELVIPDAQRTPVVTVVRTLTPTPMATTAFRYAAPLLLSPEEDAQFVGREARIVLQWVSVVTLPESEWYEVKLWTARQGEANAARFYTQASSLVVPSDAYSGEGTGIMYWTVSVVYRARTNSALSPAAKMRHFHWR
jgi:LysM repeat protein